MIKGKKFQVLALGIIMISSKQPKAGGWCRMDLGVWKAKAAKQHVIEKFFMVLTIKVTKGDGKDGEDRLYLGADVFMKGERELFSYKNIILIIFCVVEGLLIN